MWDGFNFLNVDSGGLVLSWSLPGTLGCSTIIGWPSGPGTIAGCNKKKKRIIQVSKMENKQKKLEVLTHSYKRAEISTGIGKAERRVWVWRKKQKSLCPKFPRFSAIIFQMNIKNPHFLNPPNFLRNDQNSWNFRP